MWTVCMQMDCIRNAGWRYSKIHGMGSIEVKEAYAALKELGAQGIIRGYSFAARPIGEKMKIDLEIDLPGHIENIEVKMGVGSNGSM